MKHRVGIVPKPKLEPEAGTETDRQHFLRRRAQILARRGPDREREAEPETPLYLQTGGAAAEAAAEEEAEHEIDVPRPGLARRAELPEAAAEVGVLEELPEPAEAEVEIAEGEAEVTEAEAELPEEVEEDEEAAEGEVEAEEQTETESAEEPEPEEDDPGAPLREEEEERERPSAPTLPTPPAGMRVIRRQVSSRAQAMPTPRITAGTEAVREAEFVRERAEQRGEQTREGLEPSAQEAMPEVPPELPGSLSSPDNPVPDINQPLQDASNKTLDDQTPPALVRTPQGNMPEMGRRPLPPDRIRELSRFMESGPQMSDPNDQARMRLQLQWEALMSKPEAQEGEGEQQPLVDVPPPEQAQVPEGNKATISQALARLLQDPNGEAQRMMERARSQAFVSGILNNVRETRNVGDDQVPEFAQVFGTQLDSIREEAGIAAEELDAAVEERRQELAAQRQEEEETLQMCIADEGAAVTAENQAVADAIAGTRRGMDAQAEEVQASMGGADRVRAIENRRDRLLGDVTQHVAREDTDYRRAGETRASELDSLERAQLGAYRYAVQQDEFQLNQEPGERSQLEIQELVAESRDWLEKRERKVRKRFGALKKAAEKQTTAHRTAITSAGMDAKENIREWANTELGEETSWWDRLVAMVEDWLSQAEANADQWEQVQNTEHAEAASGFVDMMGQVERAAQGGITEQQILQGNELTEEEQAVIHAYFNPPEGQQADPIYAIAVGIRERIFSQRKDELVSRLESQVMNGDYHWSVLEEVGRAYSPDFDAGNRASRLYGAFYPGITGLGTEEEDVMSALAGLVPVQAKAVREAYHSMYGETLDDALDSEMDTDGERSRARSLLSGDQPTADAAALHMAMEETWLGTGMGTEEELIFTTLRNKSPEEVEAIVEAYRRDYGRDLRPLLREELNDWATLSEHDQDRAMALMDSDTPLADAIAADQALHGFSWGYAFNLAYGTEFEAGGRDEFTAVYDTIREEVAAQATREQWTDAQFQAELQRRVEEVETRYNERYPWRTMRSAVEERFGEGPNRDLVMATLENNELQAEAARIAIENDSWIYASDDVIIDVVERRYDRALEGVRRDMGPELRREMEAELQRRDEQHFEDTGEYLTGEERYAMRQQLEVDMEHQMEEVARERAMADTERFGEVFEEEYDETLESAVKRGTNLTGEDHALTALRQGGYLTRYQRLKFATSGWGTNEEDADRAVEGATPEELADMDRQWQDDNGGQSMREGLLGGWSNLGFGELSGDDALDMQVSLEGRPMTLEKAQEIAALREELAEPSHFLGIEVGGAEHDLIRFRRQQLDENAERLRQPVRTEEERRERDHLIEEFAFNQQAVESAVQQHRARVSAITDAVANTLSMVVAVAVGAAIAFFSGGSATPLAIALIASVAGTMTGIGTRMAMLGNRYGYEQFGTDVAIGVVDAVVAAATAGIGNRLLGISQIARGAASGVPRGALGAIQRRLAAVMARIPNIGPLAKNMRTSQWLSRMAQGRWYQRALAHGVAESVENAAGALPTAVATQMMDERNWEGGFQVGNVMKGIGAQVGMGVGMGLAMSGGMSGMGRLFAGARRMARGPRLGAEPRLTTPDQLPLNDAQYQAGLREFQNANPGRTAADFDAVIQAERQRHLQDYQTMNPGKTEADFDAYLRQESARREAEFGEMHRGRGMDFDVEQGRQAAEALGRAHEEAQAQQALRDELSDALPESRRADLADVPISRLSDAEFTRATGQLTGDAAVVVRDGQAHLVVRQSAEPGSIRAQADQLADMTAPGTAGRVVDPAQALPRDLRGRVHIETNPDLPPRSVQVHYETHNGLITAVWVEAGPGARAIDIQMHAPTVRAMRRLQGISGQIRQALDRMAEWLGRNPRPAPGTKAFEARLEMEKLPGIIQERAQALRNAATLEEQLRIAAEIEHLQAQADGHARFVDAIDAEPGRGYVAAEGLTQAEVEARIARFEAPEVQQTLRNLEPADRARVLHHLDALENIAAKTADDPAASAAAIRDMVDTWRRLDSLPDADPQTTGRLLAQAAEADDPVAHMRSLRDVVDQLEGLPDRPDGLTQGWLRQLADQPVDQVRRRMEQLSQVVDALPVEARGSGAALLGRLHGAADPEAGLRGLHGLARSLDADEASALIQRMGRWGDEIAGGGTPAEFLGRVGDLLNHPLARNANNGPAYQRAISELVHAAAEGGDRLRMLGQVERLLANGHLNPEALTALAERMRFGGFGDRAPVTPGHQLTYITRVADFVDASRSALADIQKHAGQPVDVVQLMSDLVQASTHFRSNARVLGENLPAFLNLLAKNLSGSQPNTQAVSKILRYLDDFSSDPAGVSADLMTTGRLAFTSHGADASRHLGDMGDTLNSFAKNIDERGRMGGRRTWEDRLRATGNEFDRALAGDITPAMKEAAESVDKATQHAGWDSQHRGMLMQQWPWIQAVADATGDSVDDVIARMIDPNQPLTTEARYNTARVNLRDALLDRIFIDGVDRPDMNLLARALDNAPDSGAKGILFEHYMRRRLGRLTPEQAEAALRATMAAIESLENPRVRDWLKNANELLHERHGGFTQSEISGMRAHPEGNRNLPGTRSADDTAIVDTPRTHMGGPGKGPIFIDYKAGPGAFQEAQARRYIAMLLDETHPGRMVDRDGGQYNGLIYVADSQAHAEHAMREVARILDEMVRNGEMTLEQRRQINLFFAYPRVDEYGVRMDFLWRPWYSSTHE